MVYRQGYFICYYRYVIELVKPLILLTLVAHYFAITEGHNVQQKGTRRCVTEDFDDLTWAKRYL